VTRDQVASTARPTVACRRTDRVEAPVGGMDSSHLANQRLLAAASDVRVDSAQANRWPHDYGLWGGVSGKNKVLLTPFVVLHFCSRAVREAVATDCLNRLSALWWRTGGNPSVGRNRGTWSKQPKLDAWNVGHALTTSGRPLLASLPGRDGRRVLGLL
jgi:hypothetical protein